MSVQHVGKRGMAERGRAPLCVSARGEDAMREQSPFLFPSAPPGPAAGLTQTQEVAGGVRARAA